MMRRKITIFMIIAALLVSLLPACSSEKGEYGVVEDIEIENQEKEKEPPVFEKQAFPFIGYSTQTVKSYASKMSFDIPSEWSVSALNPSCIRIDIPDDDLNLPGNTIYVKSIFNFATENTLNDSAGDAKELYKPFMPYIEGLRYNFGGERDGSLRRWRGTFDSMETPTFVKDGLLAATGILYGDTLINKSTLDVISSDAVFTGTFFKWQGFPVMISIFTTKEQQKSAKEITEFIMSSMTYLPHKINKVETRETNNVKISLPAEFEADGNIFRSPYNDISSSSGMSIGVFRVTDDIEDSDFDKNAVSSYDLTQGFGNSVIYDLVPIPAAGMYTAYIGTSSDYKENMAGEARAVSSLVNLVADSEYSSESVDELYGPAAVANMDLIFIKKGENTYMIASLYSTQQENLTKTIEKLAIKTLED